MDGVGIRGQEQRQESQSGRLCSGSRSRILGKSTCYIKDESGLDWAYNDEDVRSG